MLDNLQCGAKLFDFVPREDQICAGGEGGKDSCGVSFVRESISFSHKLIFFGFRLKEGVSNHICVER